MGVLRDGMRRCGGDRYCDCAETTKRKKASYEDGMTAGRIETRSLRILRLCSVVC
jgi:hypothetical protein